MSEPSTYLLLSSEGDLLEGRGRPNSVAYFRALARKLCRDGHTNALRVVHRGDSQVRYNPAPGETMYAYATSGRWGKSAICRHGQSAVMENQ